jgi:uracil-DNA glycosylase
VKVTDDGQGTTAGRAEVLAEVVRHLEWMRDSGEGEVLVVRGAASSSTPTRPPTATAPSPRPPAHPERSAAQSKGPPLRGGEGDEKLKVVSLPLGGGGSGRGSSAPTSRGTPTYSLADKGCGSDALLALRADVGECTRCKLAGGRTTLVFGTGDPRAELMFVGEGPGADEDAQGEPFVGKAGQLLTKMIEAMGFRREDVYIANVVKCRPPGNRDPEPDEIAACEPFLARQIAAIGPKVVVALGRFAVQTLLRDPTPISRQRGSWRQYGGVKLMPTFHPAYLLRNPPEKKRAWEDLQLVMKELGKLAPKG